jgi:hypothetical protein
MDRSLFLSFTTVQDLGTILRGFLWKLRGGTGVATLPHGISAETLLCAAEVAVHDNGKEEKRETKKAEKKKDPTKFGNPDFAVSFFFRGGNKRRFYSRLCLCGPPKRILNKRILPGGFRPDCQSNLQRIEKRGH